MFSTLEPPPTPIMLYVGAGYDLSPLLTFAPGGSPYPIVPLSDRKQAKTIETIGHEKQDSTTLRPRETYTSFIFVDAKPRHTSTFMVPDFEEWKGLDVRVRCGLSCARVEL
jgi:hypothetical protein